MSSSEPSKIRVSNVNPETMYELHSRIGRGSFGEVFKAIDKRNREVVAIKVIFLEAAEDEIEDIQQEIAVLSQCNNPQIIKYFGSFLKDTSLWIVMEYLGGGSALDLLKPGPITEAYIPTILREILKGLEYLHSRNMIHRDIKAANVLFSYSGDVKLADFGVASQLNATFNKRCSFVGTPCWMAPELIQRCAYDSRVDIWSTGITALELAKGVPPYADLHPVRALMVIPRNPPPQLTGNFSKAFKEFVESCLIKDPKNRAMAHELLRLPFIRRAHKNSALQDLIERYRRWSSYADTEEDEDDDDDDDNGYTGRCDLSAGNTLTTDCANKGENLLASGARRRNKNDLSNASPAESLNWVFDTIRAAPSTPRNSADLDVASTAFTSHTDLRSASPYKFVERRNSVSEIIVNVGGGTADHHVTKTHKHFGDSDNNNNNNRYHSPENYQRSGRLPQSGDTSGEISVTNKSGVTAQNRHSGKISVIDARTPSTHDSGGHSSRLQEFDIGDTRTHTQLPKGPYPRQQQQPYNSNNNNPRTVITHSDGHHLPSPAYRSRILPVLLELRGVYTQVREGCSAPVDKLMSTFQAVDSESSHYTMTFLTELLTRAFDCNPRLLPAMKQRALDNLRSGDAAS